MHAFNITHDDISYAPATSLIQDDNDGTSRLAMTEGLDAYHGRHVREDIDCTEEAPPVNGSHPRRRGFGILSRLARVDADSIDADFVPTGAHAALVDA